jgi:transcriptional repressor NrdR
MKCPYCNAPDTKVLDSRNSEDGAVIRRRRKCESEACQKRFTTFEKIELDMPMVIKLDGRREADKIKYGLEKACQKLKISTNQIERVIENIEKKILETSDKEINSKIIGNLVMMHLRHLDPVAYIRFASVYRKFQDVDEFVNDLKHDEVTQFKLTQTATPKDLPSEH